MNFCYLQCLENISDTHTHTFGWSAKVGQERAWDSAFFQKVEIEREGDSEGPVYHATGQMKTSCANVAEQVHWIVNDSPRDAILCMARADVLITSLSSMSWAAAISGML